MKKKIIVCILALLFILPFGIKADEFFVPMLMYHNINDNYNPSNASAEISGEMFEEHLLYLKENGYSPIFLKDYYQFRTNGERLPDKPIVITFDDGYLNNYTVAYPLLKKYNMNATIFIITGRTGLQGAVKYPHFTWAQAMEMDKSPYVDIQSHTQYHNDLSSVNKGVAVLELRKSKRLIEKMLNKEVLFLAYPYGSRNEVVIKAAKKAGYKAAVLADAVNQGVNRSDTDLMQLKRIAVYGTMTGDDLINEIKKNESW